jgi:APA family basic amino acid/polyamine antiporter
VLATAGTFEELTNMAVMSYAIFWIPVILAVFVLRRRRPTAPRPFRVPGYPLVPLLVVLVMVWILISALLTTPKECVATIVLILLGLPLYPFFHRRQPRRPSRSPAPTA